MKIPDLYLFEVYQFNGKCNIMGYILYLDGNITQLSRTGGSFTLLHVNILTISVYCITD